MATQTEQNEMDNGKMDAALLIQHTVLQMVRPSGSRQSKQNALFPLHLYLSLLPSSVLPSVLFFYPFSMPLLHLHFSSLVSMRFIRPNKSFSNSPSVLVSTPNPKVFMKHEHNMNTAHKVGRHISF